MQSRVSTRSTSSTTAAAPCGCTAPLRHHGLRINAGRPARRRRIINEHDEAEPDLQEELYLVTQGRAVFELDGERLDAPLARSSSSSLV